MSSTTSVLSCRNNLVVELVMPVMAVLISVSKRKLPDIVGPQCVSNVTGWLSPSNKNLPKRRTALRLSRDFRTEVPLVIVTNNFYSPFSPLGVLSPVPSSVQASLIPSWIGHIFDVGDKLTTRIGCTSHHMGEGSRSVLTCTHC